jgi:hypothetical protein
MDGLVAVKFRPRKRVQASGRHLECRRSSIKDRPLFCQRNGDLLRVAGPCKASPSTSFGETIQLTVVLATYRNPVQIAAESPSGACCSSREQGQRAIRAQQWIGQCVRPLSTRRS